MERIVFRGMDRLLLCVDPQHLVSVAAYSWLDGTNLFSDMESEMFRILLSVPPNIIQVKIFDISMLEVLYSSASTTLYSMGN